VGIYLAEDYRESGNMTGYGLGDIFVFAIIIAAITTWINSR